MNRFRSFLRLGLGTIGSIVGIGSGLNSLFGSGSSSGGSPGTYVPTGRGMADQTWQQVLGQLVSGIGGQQQAINPLLQSGLQAASPGGAFGNLPDAWQQLASGLLSQGLQQQRNAGVLQDAGWQSYLTGLDPQKALYNRTAQQIQDASRAATSARGIGMSGNAAGIENQAMSNFNIDWNNQQLGRQLAGLGGLGQAMSGAANQFRGVGQDFTGMAGLQNAAATYPFQIANAYTGASSPISQQYGGVLQSILPYLNFGNQASQNAFGQNQVGLNNLTTGLSQLGQVFNQPGQQQSPAPIYDQSTTYDPGVTYGP